MSTHDEFPCHCLLQTWWYPGRINLVLIRDCGELLSMGLPDSSQPIMIVILGVMMAIPWLEANVKENNRQEAPMKDRFQEYSEYSNGSEKDMGQKASDAMV